MNLKLLLAVTAVVLVMLAATNPTVEQYRGHIKEREGLAGTLGLLAADLLSVGDGKKSNRGIHRESYVFFSRFYLGGDGLLPRQDLAWGALGRFWDIEPERQPQERR